MENPTEIQFATALKEKCTVFVASDNVLLEKLMYSGIFTYLCDSDTNHTVVWVCLNHSPVAILKKFKDFGCDIEQYENQILFIDTVSGIAGSHNKNVVSCLSIKDYTELILCTHRLSNANALIVLDDLDALLSTAKPEVIEKVLKRWDQKLKEQRSSFITTITKGILDTRDENQILRLFDVAYIIDTKQMNNKRNPSESLSYELQGNKLILKPSPFKELSKSYLNKLFTISPDEIDNLNSQIYSEFEKYKDII
jgi:hypothetical protein